MGVALYPAAETMLAITIMSSIIMKKCERREVSPLLALGLCRVCMRMKAMHDGEDNARMMRG